jgi:hypothetical protein
MACSYAAGLARGLRRHPHLLLRRLRLVRAHDHIGLAWHPGLSRNDVLAVNRHASQYPCTVGHEIVGTVVRAGKDSGHKVGARVGVGAVSALLCLCCRASSTF